MQKDAKWPVDQNFAKSNASTKLAGENATRYSGKIQKGGWKPDVYGNAQFPTQTRNMSESTQNVWKNDFGARVGTGKKGMSAMNARTEEKRHHNTLLK